MTPGGAVSGRALGLVAAGATAVVASRGFGTAPLAVLGVGLIALPVLVTALVALAGVALRVERTIAPAPARADEPARVRLRVRGPAAAAGILRLLEVDVDPGLAGLAEPGTLRSTADGAWTLRPRRGDHRLAPAAATIRDPFGLARRVRRGPGREALVVLPSAPALEGVALGAPSGPEAGRRRARKSGVGELERVRDYRHGDPLSRVHWGQTAKRGRLQTKELRAPRDAGDSVVVLLDGSGPQGDDFETAVTAAAALVRHLAVHGRPAVLAATGAAPVRLPSRAGWPAAEQLLARVRAAGDGAPSVALRGELAGHDAPDLVILVSASPDPALPEVVAAAHHRGHGVAVVLAGTASAAPGELAAAGADVALVPSRDRVVAALSRPPQAATGAA